MAMAIFPINIDISINVKIGIRTNRAKIEQSFKFHHTEDPLSLPLFLERASDFNKNISLLVVLLFTSVRRYE